LQGLAETGHLTNEKVWDLTSLPPRLAVIGAGPIGAELAQAFRRFGSEVTVFDVAPRLLGREDEQAAGVIHRVFEAEGIGLALRAEIERVSHNGEAKQIAYTLDGKTRTLIVDEILVAAGRLPNLEGLEPRSSRMSPITSGGSKWTTPCARPIPTSMPPATSPRATSLHIRRTPPPASCCRMRSSQAQRRS
jgi:pyruvate/2-oxoglutarate dehydrogenase complex dihydrolipoamide dehydrogenase (E3) component